MAETRLGWGGGSERRAFEAFQRGLIVDRLREKGLTDEKIEAIIRSRTPAYAAAAYGSTYTTAAYSTAVGSSFLYSPAEPPEPPGRDDWYTVAEWRIGADMLPFERSLQTAKERVAELARSFGLVVMEAESSLNEAVAVEDTTQPIVVKTKRQIQPL